jgi:hypothetical protein
VRTEDDGAFKILQVNLQMKEDRKVKTWADLTIIDINVGNWTNQQDVIYRIFMNVSLNLRFS